MATSLSTTEISSRDLEDWVMDIKKVALLDAVKIRSERSNYQSKHLVAALAICNIGDSIQTAVVDFLTSPSFDAVKLSGIGNSLCDYGIRDDVSRMFTASLLLARCTTNTHDAEKLWPVPNSHDNYGSYLYRTAVSIVAAYLNDSNFDQARYLINLADEAGCTDGARFGNQLRHSVLENSDAKDWITEQLVEIWHAYYEYKPGPWKDSPFYFHALNKCKGQNCRVFKIGAQLEDARLYGDDLDAALRTIAAEAFRGSAMAWDLLKKATMGKYRESVFDAVVSAGTQHHKGHLVNEKALALFALQGGQGGWDMLNSYADSTNLTQLGILLVALGSDMYSKGK